jgi:hypothetical protein
LPVVSDPLLADLDATQNLTIVPTPASAWTNQSSLTISGPGSLTFRGGLEGTGDVTVSGGGDLTAGHIVAEALEIGGAAASPAIVTIAASDANGNPLVAKIESADGAAPSSSSSNSALAALLIASPPDRPNLEFAGPSPSPTATDTPVASAMSTGIGLPMGPANLEQARQPSLPVLNVAVSTGAATDQTALESQNPRASRSIPASVVEFSAADSPAHPPTDPDAVDFALAATSNHIAAVDESFLDLLSRHLLVPARSTPRRF